MTRVVSGTNGLKSSESGWYRIEYFQPIRTFESDRRETPLPDTEVIAPAEIEVSNGTALWDGATELVVNDDKEVMRCLAMGTKSRQTGATGGASLFAHTVPVYPCTLDAASSSLAWPLVPHSLLIVYQCTRTHSSSLA